MTDKYTKEQKVERLLELVPDLSRGNAETMLGYMTDYGWMFTRIEVLEAADKAVKDIHTGVAFAPLYMVLR